MITIDKPKVILIEQINYPTISYTYEQIQHNAKTKYIINNPYFGAYPNQQLCFSV